MLSVQIPDRVVLEPSGGVPSVLSEKGIEVCSLWQLLDMGTTFLKSEVTPFSLSWPETANAGLRNVGMHKEVDPFSHCMNYLHLLTSNFIWCYLSCIQHEESLPQVFGGRFTSDCFSHFWIISLLPWCFCWGVPPQYTFFVTPQSPHSDVKNDHLLPSLRSHSNLEGSSTSCKQKWS